MIFLILFTLIVLIYRIRLSLIEYELILKQDQLCIMIASYLPDVYRFCCGKRAVNTCFRSSTVKPSPPVNLSHIQTIEAELILLWDDPPDYDTGPLRYEVRYSSNTTHPSWQVTTSKALQALYKYNTTRSGAFASLRLLYIIRHNL